MSEQEFRKCPKCGGHLQRLYNDQHPSGEIKTWWQCSTCGCSPSHDEPQEAKALDKAKLVEWLKDEAGEEPGTEIYPLAEMLKFVVEEILSGRFDLKQGE